MRLLLPVVLIVAVAACGGGDGEGASADDSPAPTDEQVPGGRLVVALDSESAGFDPVNSGLAAAGITVAAAIFDPLIVENTDGDFVPYLAESMEPNADHTQWTMTLRPGVTFHDGAPLDAQAVAGHVEATLQSPFGFAFAGLEGVTVVDELTLTWDLSEPWVSFPSYLSGSLGMVRAPSMLADPDGAANPVGTGPFVFTDWRPNERLVVTRYQDYWRAEEGLPYLDEVEFRPITVFQSALDALTTGEVDALSGYDGGSLAAVQEAEGVQVHLVDNGAFVENYVLLNNAVAPFDNVHARRALSLATDRDEIIDVLDRGLGEAATGPFSGQEEYPVPENFPGYDPDLAAEELDAYKADTGEPLSFEITAPSTPEGLREAELLQDMWGRVGIEVGINQIELSQQVVAVFNGEYQAAAWSFDGYPDADWQIPFWTTPGDGPITTNFARLSDPEIDRLMFEARATVAEDDRRALYAEVAQRIVDRVPWVYTTVQQSFLAADDEVVGLGSFPLPDGGRGNELVQQVIRVSSLSLRS